MAEVQEEEEDDLDLDRGIFAAIAFCALHRSRLVARGAHSSEPLVLTASAADDAELLLKFRGAFPLLDVAELCEADLKEGRAQDDWRRFLEVESTGAEELTMLRCESNGGYTDENMMLVPRLQFMCIEVAREIEGLGAAASEAALAECMSVIRDALRSADASSRTVLQQLHAANSMPCPNRSVLSISRVGRAVRRASQCDDVKVSAAAKQLLRRWKTAILLSDLARTGKSDGASTESVQDAARVALQALDARGGADGHGLADVDGDSDDDSNIGTDDHQHEQSAETGDAKGDAGSGGGQAAPFVLRVAASWSSDWKPPTALTEAMIEHGVDLLGAHGVCHIPCALPSEMTEQLCSEAHRNSATLRQALVKLKGQEVADADVFRFYECSQRCAGRLDFRLGLDAPPFNDDELIYNAMWWPLIQRLLGENAVLLTAGVVMAYPIESPVPLGWHRDGPHLYDMHLPPHAFNVMVPLCDCDEELGPTEYVPGSHIYGASDAKASTVHFCEGDTTPDLNLDWHALVPHCISTGMFGNLKCLTYFVAVLPARMPMLLESRWHVDIGRQCDDLRVREILSFRSLLLAFTVQRPSCQNKHRFHMKVIQTSGWLFFVQLPPTPPGQGEPSHSAQSAAAVSHVRQAVAVERDD